MISRKNIAIAIVVAVVVFVAFLAVSGVGALLISGDFTGPIMGQEEDSELVNIILSMREFLVG